MLCLINGEAHADFCPIIKRQKVPMRPPEVNPERNLAVVEVRFARWLTKELNPVDAEVACQP